MSKVNICVCGCKVDGDSLCDECRSLLRAKKSKNISIIEKFRFDYNQRHGTYKSYGQFVLLLDTIDRGIKSDDRRKKAVIKKIRRNRREN